MIITTVLVLSQFSSTGINKDSFPVDLNSKVYYSTRTGKFKSLKDRRLVLNSMDEGYFAINRITQSINLTYNETNDDDSTAVEVNERIDIDTDNPIANSDSEKSLLDNQQKFTNRNIYFKIDPVMKKLQEIRKRKSKENIFEYWGDKIPKLHAISHFSGLFLNQAEFDKADTLLSDDMNGLYINTYKLKTQSSTDLKEYLISGRYYPLNTQKIDEKKQEVGTAYTVQLSQEYNGLLICEGTYIKLLEIDIVSRLLNYSSFLNLNEEVEISGTLKIENKWKKR